MSGQRVAVIGDIGGHRAELVKGLIAVGADPRSLELPPDLAVIQVGDLIHRGPDSPGVVAVVDGIMARQPDQWVQLLGNHEAQYLTKQPRFEWKEKLDSVAVQTIKRWWSDGRLRLAAAVTAPDGDWLATHAGLTHGFWQRLGAPSTAAAAATALDDLLDAGDLRAAFHGGLMIDGSVDLHAGPIWAAAGEELAPSWLDAAVDPPFHQVHGHSTIVNWNRRTWQAPRRVVELTEVDQDARHTAVRLGTHRQLAIDPCFGTRAGVSWRPLVIEGGRLA